MSRFDYVLEKIQCAPIRLHPFQHIYIADLFSPGDFAEIISSTEIRIAPADDDADLFSKLFDVGYKIIDFPGCIVDQPAYIEWRRTKDRGQYQMHSACEGFGMTLRLIEPCSSLIAELIAFLESEAFHRTLAERLGVDIAACKFEGGIQKYLDGYEISPHPDIRRKAATFMINVNPHEDSESASHHTHYLRLKPEYAYIQRFWEQNSDCERCWVPWDWCETQFMQPANNSMVLFSPANDTVHGVKADYEHLCGQRTQLYGNLWYNEKPAMRQFRWEDMGGGSIESIREAPVLPPPAVVASSSPTEPANFHPRDF